MCVYYESCINMNPVCLQIAITDCTWGISSVVQLYNTLQKELPLYKLQLLKRFCKQHTCTVPLNACCIRKVGVMCTEDSKFSFTEIS